MTIGKKLYYGFGAILGILFLLFLANTAAVLRERSARADASAALETVRSLESIRYLLATSNLNLRSFLLSGDPRDEEKVTQSFVDIAEALRRGETQASSDTVRSALARVDANQAKWVEQKAKPLLAKRHQVDNGDATASDLQVFYLQKDPTTLLNESAGILEATGQEIDKSLAATTNSATWATSLTTYVTTIGTLLAILAGFAIAYYTAKSITDPLKHLMTVAREIGDFGDLDQNIDVHRNDEIGALATTFNNLVAYLKEMAAVSISVSEGDLSVEVVPRSKRDTLANAFLRMSHGLQQLVRQVRDSASQVSAGSNQVAGASD